VCVEEIGSAVPLVRQDQNSLPQFIGVLARLRNRKAVVKKDVSRIAAVSHEILRRRTLGAPNCQAMWQRIVLAEADQIFAQLA
jgi:hypothetical protein